MVGRVPRRPGVRQGDDVTSALYGVENRVLVGSEVHASVDPVRGGGCEGLKRRRLPKKNRVATKVRRGSRKRGSALRSETDTTAIRK